MTIYTIRDADHHADVCAFLEGAIECLDVGSDDYLLLEKTLDVVCNINHYPYQIDIPQTLADALDNE